MSTKHTPGPWHVDRAHVVGPDSVVIVRQAAAYDDAQNDLRLIAAAPELLEALQSLLQHVEHADSCGDHDAYNHASVPTCGCGLDSALELAQAAIAKATQP